MRYNFPYATRGQRIGLLGGSFDPAHEGHVHITKEALKRFKLDQVWWLISPKNPLKAKNPNTVSQRIKEAKLLFSHPRVVITDLEIQLTTQYTSDTILKLKKLYPGVSFVWLMGADNIPSFNLWKNWKKIMREVPIGVVDRPGSNYATRKNKMTESFKGEKIPGTHSKLLAFTEPPAWCYISTSLNHTSSSQIRLVKHTPIDSN